MSQKNIGNMDEKKENKGIQQRNGIPGQAGAPEHDIPQIKGQHDGIGK